MASPTYRVTTCAGCGEPLGQGDRYHLSFNGQQLAELCAACAQAVCEGFTAPAALLEAAIVVRTHQRFLSDREVRR